MHKNGIASNKALEAYVASVKTKSEDLIKNDIPRKILELNMLLDSDEFNFEKQRQIVHEAVIFPATDANITNRSWKYANGHKDNEVTSTIKQLEKIIEEDVNFNGITRKRVTSPSGPLPTNPIISQRIETVKPLIRDLVEHAGLLKMWVILLIPHIEDGNNFGVSIQESILGEVKSIEAVAASYYGVSEVYHINRAKSVSKVLKYPDIDDYRRLVVELDEKKIFSLRDLISDIRNHYIVIYDVIMKNWEKILTPRTSNAENLY